MFEFSPLWISQLLRQMAHSFSDPFSGISDKPRFRGKLGQIPEPSIRYMIFFTPRSGSSRLTELVKDAGGCGIPGEHFNPQLMKKSAAFLGAQDLEDYIHLLSRRRSTNGVFGSEMTLFQLHATFRTQQRFFDCFRPTASLFLLREDIVAQAVSLSRKKQTGIAHTLGDAEPAKNVDFQYRPREIQRNLGRLLFMERRFEDIFRRQRIEPLRMSYEMLTKLSPEEFVPVIAKYVGATCERYGRLSSRHIKTGDSVSEEYIARYREENIKLLSKVDASRSPTLDKLTVHHEKFFTESG